MCSRTGLIFILIILSGVRGFSQIPVSEKIVYRNGNPFYEHRVEQGQTLFSIAKAYQVTIEQILQSNEPMDQSLKVGQIIFIPVVKTDKSGEQNSEIRINYRRVARGETLYSLAREYNTTVEKILEANDGLPQGLQEGMIIRIPVQIHGSDQQSTNRPAFITTPTLPEPPVRTEQPEPDTTLRTDRGYFEYQERNRETIYQLAIRYRVDVDSILKLNPGLGEQLSKDQIIRIPSRQVQRDYLIHTAREKTSLSRIARNYGVSEAQIRQLNPYISKQIRPGQNIKIPLPPRRSGTTPSYPAINPDPSIESERETSKPPTDQPAKAEQKKVHRIALFLPLNLNNSVSLQPTQVRSGSSGTIPKTFQSLHFYEGLRIAADSLASTGFKAEIYVFDVGERPQDIDQLLQRENLKDFSLFIGPFHAATFKKLAEYARQHQIPIVNPLSTSQDIIINNPVVCKIQPDQDKLPEIIGKYIGWKYRDARVFLARQPGILRETELQKLRSAIRENLLGGQNDFIELALDQNTSRNITSQAASNKENLVIIYSSNQLEILRTLRELNISRNRFDITVIGLPDWLNIEGLDYSQLNNLSAHFVLAEHINYHDESVKHFVKTFRETCYTEPDVYAFRGFDIGIYFFSALMKYGDNLMNNLARHQVKTLNTNIRLISEEGNGFINSQWKIIRMSGFRLFEMTPLPEKRW